MHTLTRLSRIRSVLLLLAVTSLLVAVVSPLSREAQAAGGGAGSVNPLLVQTTSGIAGQVKAVMSQPDGKLLAAGSIRSYNGVPRPKVVRFEADGSLDAGFAPTGTGLNGTALAIARQTDGKVIVGGEFTSYNGTLTPGVARLNTDGTLDTIFTPIGTGLNGNVNAVAVSNQRQDHRGRRIHVLQRNPDTRVARLNADGSLDTNFTPTGTGLNDEVRAIVVQADGKVLIGGAFTSYDGVSASGVARLNSDGTLDDDFTQAGATLNSAADSIAVQADGKVVLGGYFTVVGGTTNRDGVARLNPDGSLDADFQPWAPDGDVLAVAIQADGRILIGGVFAGASSLARLGADGSLDAEFTRQTSTS